MAQITLRTGKSTPLTIAEVDANFTNLNSSKLEVSLFTGQQILDRLKEVDGSGSGLDADVVDGLTPTSDNVNTTIVARDASGNFSANTINANLIGNVTAATVSTNTLTATGNITANIFIGSLSGTATNSSQLGSINASNYALLDSPALIGTPTVPTANTGANNTQIANTAFVFNVLSTRVYPVGSIYINASNNTNPATLLGFGTWVAFGAGRMPIGFDSNDSLFNAGEKAGGSKDAIVVSHTHTGTTSTTGNHNHIEGAGIPTFSGRYGRVESGIVSTSFGNGAYFGNTGLGNLTSTAGAHNHTFTTDSSGVTGTNANLPPYIVVYMWKRTA